MSKEINLTEILKKSIDNPNNRDLQTLIERYASPHDILEAMKEACIQTLELAAENATIFSREIEDSLTGQNYYAIAVNKYSILNTINQIE